MAELPLFNQPDWDDIVVHYGTLQQREGMLLLEKGAVVDALIRHHGDEHMTLDRFAYEVGVGSVATLHEYARVYRRLVALGDSERQELVQSIDEGTLLYTHVRDASKAMKTDDELVGILREAQDENWRIRRLREEMHQRKTLEKPDMILDDRMVLDSAPPVDHWHAGHGVTGPQNDKPQELGETTGEDNLSQDSSVEDIEVRRMVKQFEETVTRIRRSPASSSVHQTLANIKAMRSVLDELEREISRSEGGKTTATA